MLHPHCTFQICNAAHTQSATSEHGASKPQIDPIFYPLMIKYGGESLSLLSNAVVTTQNVMIHGAY